MSKYFNFENLKISNLKKGVCVGGGIKVSTDSKIGGSNEVSQSGNYEKTKKGLRWRLT